MHDRTTMPTGWLKPDTFVVSIRPLDAPDDRPTRFEPLPFAWSTRTRDVSVQVECADPSRVSISGDGDRLLLLAGAVLPANTPDTLNGLLHDYETRGPAFIDSVSGHFALVVVDRAANYVLVATDRMGSVSVLHCQLGAAHIFTNSGFLIPANAADVDTASVACYLAAGIHYNNRTFFRHVRLLDAGAMVQFYDGRPKDGRYWRFTFAGQPSAAPEAFLTEELGRRLVEAVRCRYQPNRPTYLSLSGGIDSRAVLGILRYRLGAQDVRTFSYSFGPPTPGSDEQRAAELAASCGYAHQVLTSFTGSVVETLVRNAVLGQGLGPVCDEVTMWEQLGEDTRGEANPVLFVGDATIVPSDVRVQSAEDALASVRMVDFTGLDWLAPMLGQATYDQMVEASRAEVAAAYAQAANEAGWLDRRDVIQFYQRQRRRYMPWREQFASPYFQIASPILDDHLLALIMQLPPELRFAKRLYKAAVHKVAPEVFRVPIATRSTYSGFWPAAMHAQRGDIADFVRSQPSPLDDLIAPDVLLGILNRMSAPSLNRSSWRWQAAKVLYATLRELRLVPAVNAARTVRPVDPVTFLKRALIVRHYLTLATNSVPA